MPEAEYDETNDEWTDEEIESFLYALVILIVVALISIFLYTRQRRPNLSERERLIAQQQHLRRELQVLRQRREQGDGRSQQGGRGGSTSAAGGGQRSKLVDGIVTFRNGGAAKWSPPGDDNTDWKRRQGRTLQSIFRDDSVDGPPPVRGSNLVVSLREMEWEDADAAMVLTMIGTCYNLFVILDIPRDVDEPEERVKMARGLLRKGGLPEEIVSDHRVVASQSTAGRIAFIRQLRPEIVLDYEEELKKQLTRFGFRVDLSRRENGDSLGVFLSGAEESKQ